MALSPKCKAQIKTLAKQGKSNAVIAKKVGVKLTTVKSVKNPSKPK